MIGDGRLRRREKSGDELKRELLKIISNSLQNKQTKNPTRTKHLLNESNYKVNES